MKKILFICDDGADRAPLAASLALNTWGAKNIEVTIAALHPKPVHPGVARVLQANSIPVYGGTAQDIKNLNVNDYDAVITLSGLAEEETPEPVRKVSKFFWNLPSAAAFRGTPEHIDEMFNRLYTEIEGNIREITKYILPN